MPLIPGCTQTSLFRSFQEYMIHRLRVPQLGPLKSNQIRITLLNRTTQYRQILNVNEIVQHLKNISASENNEYLINVESLNSESKSSVLNLENSITLTDFIKGFSKKRQRQPVKAKRRFLLIDEQEVKPKRKFIIRDEEPEPVFITKTKRKITQIKALGQPVFSHLISKETNLSIHIQGVL